MAQTPSPKKAKGSVVTPARKSAKRKSATTAKKAGVKPRKPSVKASTKRHADKTAEVRASAISARHKLPYLCATLDEALAKADAMRDSLTTAGLHTAGESVCPKAKSAQARREWCAKNGAPLVDIAQILHENKEGVSLTKRSENVLRSRVQKRGEYLHGNKFHYYSVRATAFDGESQSLAYLVRL
jgi:hypothetical protein